MILGAKKGKGWRMTNSHPDNVKMVAPHWWIVEKYAISVKVATCRTTAHTPLHSDTDAEKVALAQNRCCPIGKAVEASVM
jgi:hypothetical protein